VLLAGRVVDAAAAGPVGLVRRAPRKPRRPS